jgi:hypothetical protein
MALGACPGSFPDLGTPVPAGIVKDLRVALSAAPEQDVPWTLRVQIDGLGSSVGGVAYQCSINVPGGSACDTVGQVFDINGTPTNGVPVVAGDRVWVSITPETFVPNPPSLGPWTARWSFIHVATP